MSANLLLRSLLSTRSIRAYSVMYTTHCTATSGRVMCDDDPKHLDVQLTKPKELGGTGAIGTNPEELFAAGYSACFLAAMEVAARNSKKTLPKNSSVTATVNLGKHTNGNFGFQVQLAAKLPGASQIDADSLVKAAHNICPFSRMTFSYIQKEMREYHHFVSRRNT